MKFKGNELPILYHTIIQSFKSEAEQWEDPEKNILWQGLESILLKMFLNLQKGNTLTGFEKTDSSMKPEQLDFYGNYFLQKLVPVKNTEFLKIRDASGKEITLFPGIRDEILTEFLSKPLILIENDDSYDFYFQKYFILEIQAYLEFLRITQIDEQAEDKNSPDEKEKRLLNPFFSGEQMNMLNEIFLNRFTLISGGPGTGKTHLIGGLIYIILNQGIKPENIYLCAPTGKAAKRIRQSIEKFFGELGFDYPENMKAQTIHRMLGYQSGSGEFYFNENNQLPGDYLILDEASMVSLELMVSLFKAIPRHMNILFLGDRNQLPSIESGDLFTGFSRNSGKKSPGFHSIHLSRSYRSKKNILLTAETVLNSPDDFFHKKGENQFYTITEQTGNLFSSGLSDAFIPDFKEGKVVFLSLQEKEIVSKLSEILILYCNYLVDNIYKRGDRLDFSEVRFAMLKKVYSQFKILCFIRAGYSGEQQINRYITEYILYSLRKKGISVFRYDRFIEYQPVMVVKNNYYFDLFNGDEGYLIIHNKQPEVWFDKDRRFNLHQIEDLLVPDYAITVHKSQGSEYENILITLPDDTDNPILSKQILYTGLTRAKNCCIVLGYKDVLETSLRNDLKREIGIPAFF